MDAIRISDGKRVIIKAFDTHVVPEELPILQHLAMDHLRSNPHNHCASALDSFPIPDRESWVFVVMDTYHPLNVVPFETIGEIVELMHQLLEVRRVETVEALHHGICRRQPEGYRLVRYGYRAVVDDDWGLRVLDKG